MNDNEIETMAREFKFRAWDKENKIMMPVCSWEMGAVGYISTGSYTDKNDNEKTGGLVQEYEIMQYTGLKDKNGKEIYEGDIVEFYYKNGDIIGRGSVFYDEKEGSFYHGFCEYIDYVDFLSWRLPKRFWSNEDIYIIILGNIYENPELLEEK